MQTVTARAQAATWPIFGALTITRAHVRMLLGAALALALIFRTAGLATYGLSDDEINKVLAIEQYRHGDFGANAEHPMLMKLAMWASVDAADAWNGFAPAALAIPFETALRLPNAVAGAATAGVLYGVANVLFGPTVALTTALLWAFDPNAIAVSRIGKEDTFLLFFFLLGVWMYELAKRKGATDPARAQRWYAASGAAFGLMLASKYMPQLFLIYALFNAISDPRPDANKPAKLRYYGAMALTFLVVNPMILAPDTWRYFAAYVQGGTLQHHGYLYNGKLYVTNVPVSPLGTPWTYYVHLIVIKVPTVILGAVVAGGIEMARRHRERGFVLLRVMLVFVLLPYSLMAAKFLRYALPLFATIDLIAAVGLVAGIRWLLRKQWLKPVTRRSVAAFAVIVFATALVRDVDAASPFFSLYRNAIGERTDRQGQAFPEESYDFGVREAALAIADQAAPHAVVASDAPKVVGYYLAARGRTDLESTSLSARGMPSGPAEAWVIVQREHLSFENQALVEVLQRRHTPWREYRAGEIVAAQVYRMSDAGRARADAATDRKEPS